MKTIKSKEAEFIILYPIDNGKKPHVYKVLDKKSNNIYAAKKIERKSLNDDSKTSYFYCEYTLYHSLSFENIIHLEKEMVTTQNYYYNQFQ